MKFSYKWLKKYVDIKLTPEKLAELLTLHSFESDIIEKTGNDTILDIDILPNRSHDCLSHYGIAKEIAALTGKPLKELKTKFSENPKIKSKDFISVNVTDKIACPRYIAKVLTDIKIAPSPKWLRDELVKFKINSHDNIVDILNYAMLEMGQPMHAFDYDKLEMRKIIARRAAKGEKINTLDGGKYELNENVLVIADGKKPVAIAGIKGGLETGVSEKTKTIIIESANFEPSGIRRTDKALGLGTDAAIRFSCGIAPELAEFGLNRGCALIQEIIPGAKIGSGSVDVYPKKFSPKIIKLNLKYLRSLIGENIGLEFIKRTLLSLGAKIKTGDKEALLVTVPATRLDLELEEDLIEEVSRFYGLMNLKNQTPIAAVATPKENDINLMINKARNILASAGFSEAYNYSFIGKRDINGEEIAGGLVEIKNPASEDLNYLRPGLVINLLKNIKNNLRFFDKIKFFETGKVFSGKNNPTEKLKLAGICAVKNNKETIAGERFFEIKNNLSALLEGMGIAECSYVPTNGKWWHSGRAANVTSGKEFLGVVGEINSTTLAALDIPGRVVAFDLDFEKIATIAEEEREFTAISKYPAVIRDISILVSGEIRVSEILNVIYGTGTELVEDVDLFDYYEGGKLPEGKKNLAFHIIYQTDRTLTDDEVRREEEKIKKALIEKLGAEIR